MVFNRKALAKSAYKMLPLTDFKYLGIFGYQKIEFLTKGLS